MKSKVFVRDPYNYDADSVSVETALVCADPSLAQQSQAEEADINVIVKRFGITGQLPQNVRVPLEGDFSDALDYRQSLDAIRLADSSFSALPASVRARFSNDPGAFVEFCMNSDNLEEMRKMGLAVPAPVVSVPVSSSEVKV